jgi:nucleoside-triphosphatase THEP1
MHADARFMLWCFIMTGPDRIAVIANREALDSQALLAAAVSGWRAAGVRVAGVLAENNDEGVCSAGYLRDIASGRRFSVQLDAPPPGKTCHLDVAGMDDACAGLLGQIGSADAVVISKFGKMEAMRQGLWATFEAALAAGKPLLTTVSSRHVEAWMRFAPHAVWLDADAAPIDRWWHAVKGTTGQSAPVHDRHRAAIP